VPLSEDQYPPEERSPGERAADLAILANELATTVGADAAHAEDVDVGIGASWEAIGYILGWAGSAASVWMLAVHYSPAIKKAIEHLRHKYSKQGDLAFLILSQDALVSLVLDDLQSNYGVSPAAISNVRTLHHSPDLSEPRMEVKQLYCAYTITVELYEENFFHVWNYLATPEGDICGISDIRIPLPNVTHWSDVDRGKKMLPGMELYQTEPRDQPSD
jgi:hypothetical protein